MLNLKWNYNMSIDLNFLKQDLCFLFLTLISLDADNSL
jgi:hypothetical protein